MKVFYSSALLLLHSAVAAAAGGNPMACLSESDLVDGMDYFPDKVQPEDATLWTVEYHDTYKIATNLALKERYLLYQCGTTNDTSSLTAGMEDSNFTAILPVPLPEVGLLYTTMVPYMEILGLRTSISAILGSLAAYVSSPCVLELVTAGEVEDVPYTPSDSNVTVTVVVPVAFVGEFGDNPEVGDQIRISETTEPTNLAVLEWVKWYALFFNMEAKANEFFSQAKERHMCVESNAAMVTSDTPEEDLPTVLWAQYSDYCGGWEVARDCPNNYYCEMATSCSAKLLWSNEGSHTNPDLCFDANYMTTEEFVEFASEAEYWIYTSSNWEDAMAMFSNELSAFVSVKAKQVFDHQGQGPNAWFERRLVEPDVVLQDFCAVVGTDRLPSSTFVPHVRQWFRNVFTEPVGTLEECTNVEEPLLPKGSACAAIPSTLGGSDKPGTNGTQSGDNETQSDANGGTEQQGSSSASLRSIMTIAVVLFSALASVTMM